MCCSYDYRGFIVSSPYLFISSYQTFNLIFSKALKHSKNFNLSYTYFKNLFILSFLILNVILIFLPKNLDNSLISFNNEKKKRIVNYEQSKQIYNYLKKSECGILISNETLLKYNPNIILLGNKFDLVNNINLQKIKDLPECEDSHYIWFAYWTPENNQEWIKMTNYLKKNNFITSDGLIYKDTK